MSAPPPNQESPSSRYSFEEQPSQQHRSQNRGNRQPYEEGESLKDQVIEEVDDALGCSNRLIGCSLSLITLPFRMIWRVIDAVTD